MTDEERERTRHHIAIWKETAAELDRIKCEELRAITEDQAAIYAEMLALPVGTAWAPPENLNGSGLVEQQRTFAKARAHKSRS